MMSDGFDWEERPVEGKLIEVYSTIHGNWDRARYWDNGWDGIIEWVGGEEPDDYCELEEYMDIFPRWRYATS